MKLFLVLTLLAFSSFASAGTLLCKVSDNGQPVMAAAGYIDDGGNSELYIGAYDKYEMYAALEGYDFLIIYAASEEALKSSKSDVGGVLSIQSTTGSTIDIVCKVEE